MNKEEEIAMVIESLTNRMGECNDEACTEQRKTFHCNMMRLEARRLLELLGEEEETLEQEELRRNIKSFASTASTVFDALRSEFQFAEAVFKRAKNKKRYPWN